MELKKSNLLLGLLIAGGVFCSTASFAAEEKVSLPSPSDLANMLKSKVREKIESGSAADLCKQGKDVNPLTFRSFEGVPCCATYKPFIGPNLKLPDTVCRPFAAMAQAACKGVGDFDSSKCVKGMPSDIKANPATEIKAAIKKDPSGFVADIVCGDKADLKAGSVLANIANTPGVCDEAKAMRKKH